MKRLLLSCIIMILFAIPVWADDCGLCPKDKPCVISYPLAWGNVIGTQNVWCVNGQWHTDAVVTVMPIEGVDVLIDRKPFEVK